MDKVKRTYRDVATGLKRTARSVDGTDLKDRVGNAGDEARKDLANLGDDARDPGSGRTGTSSRPPSERRSAG